MNIFSLLEKLALSANSSVLKELSADLQKAFTENDSSYITKLFSRDNTIDVNHSYVAHCYVVNA